MYHYVVYAFFYLRQTCRKAGTESHGPAEGGQPGCSFIEPAVVHGQTGFFVGINR